MDGGKEGLCRCAGLLSLVIVMRDVSRCFILLGREGRRRRRQEYGRERRGPEMRNSCCEGVSTLLAAVAPYGGF